MSNSITLSQAVEGRILAANAKGLSINTIKEYSLYYRKLMTFMPDDPAFTSITVDRLREFMAAQTHLSKKTRSNIRVSLSSMWSWAVDYKIITANVAADLDIIKPESRAIHPYTKEDVQAMLANVDKSKSYTRPGKRECSNTIFQAVRNKSIILMLLDTGLRSSELAGLLIRDVDKRNQRCKVMGKGTKERIVPFSAITSMSVWRYLAQRPDARPDEPLFITTRDRPLSKFEIRDLIALIGDRAGVVNAHPHRFRHTFAINFIRNGGNVYTLKEILGHASLKMCLRYLEIAQADVENNYRPASPVKNWGL